MCLWVCGCVVCVDVGAWVHVWMYLSINVCVSMCVCIVCVWVFACIYVYVGYMITYMHVHMLDCVYVYPWVFSCVLQRSEPIWWDLDPLPEIRIGVQYGSDTVAIRRPIHELIYRSVPVRAVKTRWWFGSENALFHVSVCLLLFYLFIYTSECIVYLFKLYDYFIFSCGCVIPCEYLCFMLLIVILSNS